MLTRILIASLVCSMSANAAAAGPKTSPVAASVAREATKLATAQAAAAARTRIPPKYLWTGVGLLGGGGLTLLSGAAISDSECTADYDRQFCSDLKTAFVITGAAIAGAGAVVLAIGNGRREPVPSNSIQVGPRSIAWRVRF